MKVLGPNLDPRFPDCLDGKPEEARRLLRLTYDRSLECFWDLMTHSTPVGGSGSSISSHEPTLNDERLAGDPLPFGKRVTGGDVSTRGGGNETKRQGMHDICRRFFRQGGRLTSSPLTYNIVL